MSHKVRLLIGDWPARGSLTICSASIFHVCITTEESLRFADQQYQQDNKDNLGQHCHAHTC